MMRCAFTGHRPNRLPFGYNELHPDCMSLKRILTTQILQLSQNGVDTFYTGCAIGVDLISAEIVLTLRNKGYPIKLHCVLPCRNQAERWTQSYQYRHKDVLKKADSVIVIREQYTPDCMLERDRYLVDHSEYIVAVFDGIRKGGTFYTINYAEKKKRNIILINPKTSDINYSRLR